MSPRRVAVVALLVLGAIALWLAGPWGDSRTTQAGHESRATREEPASPEPALPATSGEAVHADVTRDAASAADAAPPGHVEVKVRAIDAATGEPVAGAWVHLADAERQRSDAWRASLRRHDAHVATVQAGETLRADKDGVALFLVPEGSGFRAVARTRHLLGTAQGSAAPERVERSRTEVVVPMQPDVWLTVRVVDTAGRPVEGVPVAYRETERWPIGRDLAVFLTGEDGRAELIHLGAEIRRNHRSGSRHWLTIALPLADPPKAEFDALAPPSEEIVLVLPELGRVEVEVLDIEGEPSDTRSQVMLQRRMSAVQRERYEGHPGVMIHQSWLGLQSAPLEDGVAVFEQVGLGLELEIGASFIHLGRRESIVVDGPRDPGETVRVTLRQTRLDAILSGRLLLPGGTPVADGDLRGWLVWPNGERRPSRERLRVRTDADGVFRTPVGDAPVDAVRNVRLLVHLDEPGRTVAWTTPTLPALEQGVTDLGDLEPEYQPLVAGTVLRPDGTPDAGSQVSLRALFEEATPPVDAHSVASTLAGHLVVMTDGEGRFRIDGPGFPGADCSVAALSSRPAPTAAFAPGEQGVVLRPPSPTAVRGRFLLDDGVDPALLITWLTTDGNGNGANLQPTGEFWIVVEPDREYDLALRSQATNEALHEITRILPREGEVTDLGAVDLRGRLHPFTVEVAGADGSVPEYVKVIPEDSRPSEYFRPKNVRPPVRFLTRHPAPKVTVTAPGHGLASVALVDPVTQVVLPGPTMVGIQVHGLGVLPAGTTVFVTARSGAWDELSAARVDLDSDGAGWMALPESGEWRFACALQVRTPEGGLRGSGVLASETVAVAGTGSPDAVVLRIDAAALEEFLDSLEPQ